MNTGHVIDTFNTFLRFKTHSNLAVFGKLLHEPRVEKYFPFWYSIRHIATECCRVFLSAFYIAVQNFVLIHMERELCAESKQNCWSFYLSVYACYVFLPIFSTWSTLTRLNSENLTKKTSSSPFFIVRNFWHKL